MESALADLLSELSAIQSDLLAVLADKRHRLLTSDTAAMEALREREEKLIARLQACQDRRLALLAQAADEGLPSRDLQSVAAALPAPQRSNLAPQMRDAAARMRLLQHHSLTNWVLVQRTLSHAIAVTFGAVGAIQHTPECPPDCHGPNGAELARHRKGAEHGIADLIVETLLRQAGRGDAGQCDHEGKTEQSESSHWNLRCVDWGQGT